ncbi:MAG TPA: hypothetical protein VKS60_22475 [Stellaceae bacterium]|nr:hypothetical protein [Stellaceae bacterium]
MRDRQRFVVAGCGAAALVAGSTMASGQVEWSRVGIASVYGQVIQFDHANPGTVYLGGDEARIYKSTDNGATWGKGAELASLFDTPRGITIVPQHPNTIYVASTDFVFHTGGGLYRSTDAGATFTHIQDFKTAAGTQLGGRVATDPTGQKVVYGDRLSGIWLSTDGAATFTNIVTTGNAFLQADPGLQDIYAANGFAPTVTRSLDGGATWSTVTVGTLNPATDKVGEVGVDPQHPLTIYAAYETFDSTGALTGTGIWKSTDGGTTWPTAGNVATPGEAYEIEVDPGNSNLIVATPLGHINPDGVFLSTDGGATWKADGATVGFAPFRVTVSGPNGPYRDTIMVTGDGGIARSADGGTSFKLKNGGLKAAVLYAVASGSAGQPVYVGTPDGVLESDDGATWRNITSWTGDTEVFPLAVDFLTSTPTLYAVTDTSFYRSGDDGETWHALTIPAGTNPFILATDPKQAKRIFASVGDNQLYRSDDKGKTWTTTTVGPAASALSLSGLLVHPGSTGALFAATSGGLYTSSDDGATWTQTAPQATAATAVVWIGGGLHELMFEGQDSSGDWHLYVSPDKGSAWQALDNPGIAAGASDTGGAAIVLASDKSWAGHAVFAGYTDPVSLIGATTVFESTDGGRTWTNIASPNVEGELAEGVLSLGTIGRHVVASGYLGGAFLGSHTGG